MKNPINDVNSLRYNHPLGVEAKRVSGRWVLITPQSGIDVSEYAISQVHLGVNHNSWMDGYIIGLVFKHKNCKCELNLLRRLANYGTISPKASTLLRETIALYSF